MSSPSSSAKFTSPTAQRMRSGAPATPLDYSFMGLTSLSEMLQHDPVRGKKKANDAPITTEAGGNTTELRAATTTISSSNIKSSAPISLRVNNNKLTHLDDMHDVLRAVFDDPTQLQWLDLSGNQLASISRKTFAPYVGLFTLHLHGNNLQKYSDIDNLAACLPKLHSLALHGNPLEEKKHYRNYTIASFPTLVQLDFSSITRGDREQAETWATIYKNAMKSPKKSKRGNRDKSGDGGINDDSESYDK